jgi:predicted dehydrogenase
LKKTIAIIGGEQHIGEITSLAGSCLEIVASTVRPDQIEKAKESFGPRVYTDLAVMLEECSPQLVAIANANDHKAEAILASLQAGCDVICDKPLAITMEDQARIDQALSAMPSRRVLNLMTLRGQPTWRALREIVASGRIGLPAHTHVRMAVRLKREHRPPWFLDSRRSGGLFLDLLIHGLDQVEWLTGRRIVAVTARTGSLGLDDEPYLLNHASVFCELDDGSTAVVEGQRMLPDTCGSDYRVLLAGTEGFADMHFAPPSLTVTDPASAGEAIEPTGEVQSIVADWLEGGTLITQRESLRANHLALLATQSSITHQRIPVPETPHA